MPCILHQIDNHFDIDDLTSLSWLIARYSLTVGTFVLVSGRLGDTFGHKFMFLIGFSWFAVWSLVLGLSWYSNHVLFIFVRGFQGIGPSIVLPNGLAIVGSTYSPGPRKSMVFALFGACAPGGAIIGAAFASLLNLAWWPWTFFSFAMVLAVVVVASYFMLI
jgi:MFS family permease